MKTVTAEYLAEEQTLKLDAPLEGVSDHARLLVAIDEVVPGDRPWIRLEGTLSAEEGASLAASIEELFGKENAAGR
jgi:hypothetical protein